MKRMITGFGVISFLVLSSAIAAETGNSFLLDKLTVKDKEGNIVGSYQVPKDNDILKHENAEQILYGKRLLNETKRLLPDNVGAMMNCNSCHVDQGKLQYGAPYINTYSSFPQFNPRSEKVMKLEERINGCFRRSMNGKPLPLEGKEMQAMVAYMKWLGQGIPMGGKAVEVVNAGSIDMTLTPNPERGAKIYAAQCASCHGDNGEGLKDKQGDIIFPPLWGDESFNIGAGLARTYKAASFVKYNMPMGMSKTKPWGQGGWMSDQDAVDVSEFFTHMPRPDFEGKENDWPSGKKPKDARY